MEQVLTAIQNTPVWVWPLLALTAWMGYSCSRTRHIRVELLVLVPAVFFLLAMRSLSAYADRPVLWGAWGIGLGAGFAIGWWINNRRQVRPDPANRRLELPGEWVTLSALMIYFAISYYVGYRNAVTPDAASATGFLFPILVINGGFAGFFTGRSLRYFTHYLRHSTATG